MSWINRLRGSLRKNRLENQLDDELQFHIEMRTQEFVGAGMSQEEARYRAARLFGNRVLLKEGTRDMDTIGWIETIWQDLRYGLRMAHKNRGFTAVAVLTLALGIAVNTTIFSLTSAMLLRRPSVGDPDRVAVVLSINATKAEDRELVSVPDFIAWREENRSFERIAAANGDTDFSLTGQGEPERVIGMRVSANYFRTLGVSPMFGRTLLTGEDQPGREHVAVVSQDLWQRRYASDPNILGKTIALNGEDYTVVGVMPAAFRLMMFPNHHVWTPLVFSSQQRSPAARESRSLYVFARLKPGVSFMQARAEMATLNAHRVEQDNSRATKGWSATVIPLQEYMIQEAHVRSGLTLLTGSVVFVLLIACANVANLLLGRSAVRQQEIAVRAALGAGRLRLIRQMLVESLVIAFVGGGAGLLLAYWGIGALRAGFDWSEYVRSIAADITLDGNVLAFTAGISILAALLFGLAPAMRVSGADLQSTLKQGGRTGAGDLRRGRARDVLVTGEIALAVLLLTASGLVIKGITEIFNAELGFDPTHVLMAQISLSSVRYQEPAKQAAFFNSVIRRLASVAGVQAAAVSNDLPLNAGRRAFSIAGKSIPTFAERPTARYFVISSDYFTAMRIPLIKGRVFRESDNAGAPKVAVVNRAFAQRYFPKKQAIGENVSIDGAQPSPPVWREIVGIVADVEGYLGQTGDDPQLYEPYFQNPTAMMNLIVRTTGDPNVLAPGVRRAVWSVDKDQPISRVASMTRVIDETHGGNGLFSAIMGIFAALALVLAAVGLYGVIAYAVSQRTHEIGIRMALGARKREVVRSVIGKGMLVATVGAAIGLATAAPLPRLLDAMFEGLTVHSSVIFISVPLVLLVVVLVAIYIPASRAANIDPMEALRYE